MSFISELKNEWKKAIIGLIVVFLIAKWDYIVSTFDKGKEVENQITFEENLKEALQKDSIVLALMENEKFVKILFESHTVRSHIDKMTQELEKEIHDKIVEDVTKNDTNKVSMRAFVGMGAGVRDEQVLPIITQIVKDYNDEKIAKKADITKAIKRSVKGSALKPAQF